MGLVLPTDCLLRWKSSCDSRYPCFFPNGYLYQCLRRTHFELDFWEIWLGVNLCKCGCVCLCVFWNFLQHPPFNGTLKFKWTTASKKTGLISSCSIPKHLLHALDIKETWQNTSLDARFLVSLDVFGWHVFFPGPSVATDLRTIGGWGLVLDFHILESYGPTKMPSKSKPIPNGSIHGVFEKSREFQSFRTRTWMSLGCVVLLLLLKKQPSYSLLFDSFSSTLKSKVFKSQQHIHVVLRCPVETH